jgi:hypothetical protein
LWRCIFWAWGLPLPRFAWPSAALARLACGLLA